MKRFVYLLSALCALGGCKQLVNDTPVPVVTPVELTLPANAVVLNPLGYTPLAAQLRFSSDMIGRTFIRVHGKHGPITAVEHTFSDKSTTHSVPVIGLYPNFSNTVDVRVLGDKGDTLARTTLTITTGDLPPNMPVTITAAPFNEAAVSPGLLLVSSFSTLGTSSPSTPYFMDAYGDIRWVLDYRNHPQLSKLSYDDGIDRLRNGNFIFGDISTASLYEVNLLGQVINTWPLTGYAFHHNVSEKPNGNFLVTTSKAGSSRADGTPTIEDFVVEVDRKTGHIVTEWDLKQSLDENRIAEAQSPIYSPSDWFHANSVIHDPSDNTIIVSGRHQGVVKLDYNNQVKWILAAHANWGTNRRGQDLRPYLLTPLDASGHAITDIAVVNGSAITPDFEWNWYQHDPIRMPNGDVMLFDNGDIREFSPDAGKYSRAVTFHINEANHTVRQGWTYGKERGLDTFSRVISSVQFMHASNHVVFAPGYQVQNTTGRGGKVLEIDVATKTVLNEISVSSANGWGFHRVKKMYPYPGEGTE